LTQSHSQVQSILDQIADLFGYHEIHGEAGVAVKQAGEHGCQQSGRARGQADPNLTGRRGALVAQIVYEVGRRVDDVTGTSEQILAINGQAQMACGAVEQTSVTGRARSRTGRAGKPRLRVAERARERFAARDLHNSFRDFRNRETKPAKIGPRLFHSTGYGAIKTGRFTLFDRENW
jgi:hypothetical protein